MALLLIGLHALKLPMRSCALSHAGEETHTNSSARDVACLFVLQARFSKITYAIHLSLCTCSHHIIVELRWRAAFPQRWRSNARGLPAGDAQRC
jgi:hypothetical protein